jgi:hypothetical protein
MLAGRSPGLLCYLSRASCQVTEPTELQKKEHVFGVIYPFLNSFDKHGVLKCQVLCYMTGSGHLKIQFFVLFYFVLGFELRPIP